MSEPLSLAPASVDNAPSRHLEDVVEPDGAGGPSGVIPVPVWSAGLSTDRIGPIQWRSVAALRPYAPRVIELPSFRGTPSWEMLRQLLKESGVRDPLLVLADGRVVDGVHRLELARALGLTEVPVRIVDVPEPCSDRDRIQLQTTMAALDAGRRRIDAPHLRRLILDLTQAEIQLRVVNRRAANLQRGRGAGSGPTVPTQRERGRTVGMSERTIRQLDRILREGPPDLIEAVRAGAMSVKGADQRLAQRKASQVPTGTVRARDTHTGGPGPKGTVAADRSRGIGADLGPVEPHADPGPPTPVGTDAGSGMRVTTVTESRGVGAEPGEDRPSAPAGSPSPIPPAVEAFMAVCRMLHEATRDFIRDTAHWTGERREQRHGTIWQGIRQLEEYLDWMESAGEVRPGEIWPPAR